MTTLRKVSFGEVSLGQLGAVADFAHVPVAEATAFPGGGHSELPFLPVHDTHNADAHPHVPQLMRRRPRHLDWLLHDDIGCDQESKSHRKEVHRQRRDVGRGAVLEANKYVSQHRQCHSGA